jgi:hypothetical protein
MSNKTLFWHKQWEDIMQVGNDVEKDLIEAMYA